MEGRSELEISLQHTTPSRKNNHGSHSTTWTRSNRSCHRSLLKALERDSICGLNPAWRLQINLVLYDLFENHRKCPSRLLYYCTEMQRYGQGDINIKILTAWTEYILRDSNNHASHRISDSRKSIRSSG